MKIKILRIVLLAACLLALLTGAALASVFVELPRGISVVSEQAFVKSGVNEVVLHDSVERIESRAFASSSLAYINLPDSLTYIASDAFDGCENLQAVCNEGSYAYDFCVNAGIKIVPPPQTVYVLQNENEKTCADVEAAMNAAFAETETMPEQRLRVHYYTSADADSQTQFVQDAVAANADLLMISLADAACAGDYTRMLSAAQIPVLYFNAEPKAEAVSGYDALFVGSKNGTRPGSEALGKACAEIALGRLNTGEWLTGTEYTSANGWSVLLDPVYRLAGIKIGIDPGHQRKANYGKEPIAPGSSTKKTKVSSGTYGVVTKTPEYVRVLEISKKLRKTLEELGAEVYMTRETHDVNISNVQRAKMMNNLGVDLVLRIHCDGSSARDANGISLYVRKSGTKAKQSLAAANAILPAMIKATGAHKRGVKQSNDYTGLNWSTVPCILVECGFMTNPDEDRLLAKSSYQQKLADGMTNGICKYFGR